MDNNTIKAENRLDVDILEKVSGGTGEEFYVVGRYQIQMVSTGIIVAVVNILYEYKEPAKKGSGRFDMLPSSRTLKYKTYLGVFLCPERVRLIQSLRSS